MTFILFFTYVYSAKQLLFIELRFDPSNKMIFHISSFILLICINSLKSDVTNTTYPDGAGCEEMDKSGWSLFSLANKTMDTWPWNCLEIRYPGSLLQEEISNLSPNLFDATAKDYTGFVQYYVERREADVCLEFNGDNVSALYIAIAKGNLRMVQYMFANSDARYCDFTSSDLESPMTCAALHGHLDILKYLLEEKKLTDYEEFRYIAFAAAKRGQLHILKYLVDEKGFIINPDDGALLFTAAKGGNVDMLTYLLYEQGINAEELLDFHGGYRVDLYRCGNWTLLCNAAVGGKLDAVIFSVEKLNNTEFFKCNEKWSIAHPLTMAVIGGSLPVLKYMIEEKGADFNCRFPDFTLLHIAAAEGHLPIVKYLVELKHMDVDLKHSLGMTPLFIAIKHNRLDVVKYLAGERNASLNVYPGSNALLLAACEPSSENNVKIVKFLVDDMKMMSRINEVDQRTNRTALMNAAVHGNLDVLKFLVDDRHVNMTIVHPENKTFMHLVAEQLWYPLFENEIPIFVYLIEEKGFKVSARTTTKETVLDLARTSLNPPEDIQLGILEYLTGKLEEESLTKE